MLSIHYALLALIGVTPLLLIDSLWIDGFLSLYAAVVLIAIALSIRPGEATHIVTSARWAFALAAIPFVWGIIQLLPFPANGVSRSIWQSAAGTLRASLWPKITIDPGLTILALLHWLTLVAIGIAAAAASIERQHAERILLALGIATVAISLILLVGHLGAFGLLSDAAANRARSATSTTAAFGIVLNAAIGVMIVERYFMRTKQDIRWNLIIPLAGAVGGFIVCALALVVAAPLSATFAASCGFVVIVLVTLVRRIGLGRRAGMATAAIAILAAITIVVSKGSPAAGDLSLRYAALASSDLMTAANRVIGEVGWNGSGAGTFEAILRLYSAQDTSAASTLAPTLASQIAIELGRPMLWILVAAGAALIVLCASGGFIRGRDFFYSVAGAGVGVTSLIVAFCDSGLTSAAVSVLAFCAIGLALAQRVSRTL